jgi:hypothetical protein
MLNLLLPARTRRSPAVPQPTGVKLFFMRTVLVAIPLLTLLLLPIGYYTYAKLTYSAYYCGSFAKLDGEIGWVLKPDASSCLGGRGVFDEKPWFHSAVFTDRNGFRAAAAGGDTPPNGVMVVGDSYAFGYGLAFEESFPGQLASLAQIGVIDAASPAYSSAQALLLARRWVGALKPQAIVFLDNGMWQRAACRGPHRPRAILKPCYWQPPDGEAVLVTPPAGRVAAWARWGVLPGGVIGAGETGWDYFLISRPLELVAHALTRLGLVSGFGHDFAAVGVDPVAMRQAVARQLGDFAEAAGVPVVLLDPEDFFPPEMLARLPEGQERLIHRIGKERWDDEVSRPAAAMPRDERFVPHDDHFGRGTNRLIALLLLAELRRLGVVDKDSQ